MRLSELLYRAARRLPPEPRAVIKVGNIYDEQSVVSPEGLTKAAKRLEGIQLTPQEEKT